ncbi:hypothetical protein GCM10022226_73960 [Sphaerisporangium flaviroseum]|uniref:Uncharacterized protein n=1 Tax=Sphaerisporangium flaviroseum TaxID=509199 RepID=A0ABP7JBR7_9ACTN
MNEQITRISEERLREAFDLLMRHVAAKNADGWIVIRNDAFWSVPVTSQSDVYSEPPELTIGTVSDAWRSLEAMVDDEGKVVGYGFVWLAEVIRAIGAESEA